MYSAAVAALWALSEGIWISRGGVNLDGHDEIVPKLIALTVAHYSVYAAIVGLLFGLLHSFLARTGVSVPVWAWSGVWSVLAVGGCAITGRWISGYLGVSIRHWPIGGQVLLVGIALAAALGLFASVTWLVSRQPRVFKFLGKGIGVAWACAFLFSCALAFHTQSEQIDFLRRPHSVSALKDDRPNVLLIVLDTLRADYLSCYGYPEASSPNLDKFATESVLFANVLSPGVWTLPSHASMFTGLSVSQHGVSAAKAWLPDDCVTLAETLRDEGYQTASMSCNPVFNGANFDQGFDSWVTLDVGDPSLARRTDLWRVHQMLINGLGIDPSLGVLPHAGADKGAIRVAKTLSQWLRSEYDPGQPFFLFLNYMETHLPYEPPWPHRIKSVNRARIAESYALNQHPTEVVIPYCSQRLELADDQIDLFKALYEGEVRYLDERLGELFSYLRKSGLLDETVVIVTSDHGDHLGEHHLLGHRQSVYQPLAHVPLIIRYPPAFPAGMRIDQIVQTTDLFGTILDLAEIEFSAVQPGGSRLLTAWRDAESWPDQAVAEHLEANGGKTAANNTMAGTATTAVPKDIRAIRRGEWKYIWNYASETGTETSELYRVTTDRLEKRNRLKELSEIAGGMRGRLLDWERTDSEFRVANVGPPEDRQSSDEHVKRMRQLGYFQ